MKHSQQLKLMKPKISNDYIVKSYKYGSNLEITTANGLISNSIRVLPDKKYLILATGEIKEMNTSAETRLDNLNSVKLTMKKLRRLISCNFGGGSNQLWITLTFKEHITDTYLAYKSFDRFIKRLNRKYKNLLYIAIIEPQASGRWHFHVLLKDTTENTLFISNKELSKLWGNGFTKVNRLHEGDNIANYVISYVSDLAYETDVTNNKKKIAKGARLYLYPKGLRIYRSSRNVNRPVEKTGLKGDLLEEYEISHFPNYVKETTHKTENDKEIKIITEYYNN